MDKPMISKFDMIAPLIVQKYERYLPTAFDESMTLLEKVNKVIEYANQVGIIVGAVVEQWNEVMKWVMEDGLTEAVSDKLDQFVLDGTLEQIINEEIFEDLNTKVDSIGVSVVSFGAVGNGVVDDTNAFKEAIAFSVANKKRLILPMPSVEYLITDTVYEGDKSPTIEGIGGYAKIRFKPINNPKKPLLLFTGLDHTRLSLKNLEIVGDETNPIRYGVFLKTQGAIRYSVFENISMSYIDTCFDLTEEINTTMFKNCRSIATEYHIYANNYDKGFNNVSFHNCNFRSTTYGIYLINQCNNVAFYDCIFDVKDRSNLDGKGGIYFKSPRNVNIVGGYIEARGKSVFEFDLGWLPTDSGYDYPVKISNVYIRNNISGDGIRNSTAVKASGRVGLTIEGCYFNGWDICIDYAQGTGTLVEDGNSFANVNTRITKSSSTGLFLDKMRGVVEQGTNANGSYVRFADGLQICQHNLTSSTTGVTEWIYPIRFKESTVMSINANIHSSSISSLTSVNVATRAFDRMTFNALNIVEGTVSRMSATISLVAVGRWK